MNILQRIRDGASSTRRSWKEATGGYPVDHDVSVGDFTCLFEATTAMEEYRIESIGDERDQLERFLELVEPGTEVWDVGANIGLYSVFAAAAGGRVTAFEPDPSFAARLRRNSELNGLDVSLAEVALWDAAERLTLYSDGLDGDSPALASSAAPDGSFETRTARGDDRDPAPDVVKIDVEGAEARVLEGLTGVLDDVSAVFIEVHPGLLDSFGDSEWTCKDTLLAHGFEESWRIERDGQYHVLYQR